MGPVTVTKSKTSKQFGNWMDYCGKVIVFTPSFSWINLNKNKDQFEITPKNVADVGTHKIKYGYKYSDPSTRKTYNLKVKPLDCKLKKVVAAYS